MNIVWVIWNVLKLCGNGWGLEIEYMSIGIELEENGMSLNCKKKIENIRMHFGLVIGIVDDSLAGSNSRIVVDWKFAECESRGCRIYRGNAAEISVAYKWTCKKN